MISFHTRLTIDRLGQRGEGVAQGPDGPDLRSVCLGRRDDHRGSRWFARHIDRGLDAEPRPDRAVLPLFFALWRLRGANAERGILRAMEARSCRRGLATGGTYHRGCRSRSMRMARGGGARHFTRATRKAGQKPASPRRARMTSSKSNHAPCSPLRWTRPCRPPARSRRLWPRSGKPLDILVTATLSGLDVDLKGHGSLSEAERQSLVKIALEHDLARLSNHGSIVDLAPRAAACHGKGPGGATARRFLTSHRGRRRNARHTSVRPCRGSKTDRRSFFRRRDFRSPDGCVRKSRCL